MRTLCILAVLSLVACAEGAAPEDGRFEGEANTPPKAADSVTKDGENEAIKLPGDTTETTNPDDPTAKTPTSPTTPKPTTPNTCQTARDLGSLVADTEAATLTAQGTCSEWFRFRAVESRSGIDWGNVYPMKLRALLKSTGADFDLFVYVNKDENVLECTTPTGKSQSPAATDDSVSVSWGENFWTVLPSDDSRPVSIEVRAKDPSACGKGSWTLVLDGNR